MLVHAPIHAAADRRVSHEVECQAAVARAAEEIVIGVVVVLAAVLGDGFQQLALAVACTLVS